MALVQCKVCGSQTSDQDEICLVCGYPWRGRTKDWMWQLVALGLAIVFAGGLLVALL